MTHKKYTQIIYYCAECPLLDTSRMIIDKAHCKATQKEIKDISIIPEHCPLEDDK